MPSKKWKQLLPVALVWIVVLSLCSTHYTNKTRLWANLLTDEIVHTDDKTSLDLSSGDSYTQLKFSSQLILPAGTYRFQWNLDCDGINTLRFFTDNDALITPQSFEIYPPPHENNVYFTLKTDAEFLGFTIDFKDGTFLNLRNFRLYSPVYNDTRITLLFIAALFSFFWLCACNGRKIHPSMLLLAGAVIYASIPSFRDNIGNYHDTRFHISRLWNLAYGLRSGQFPVRCAGYSYNGYGAVTSVFYPDLFLYPFAVLLLIGASTNYVMQCIFICLNILSCLFMYDCAKNILKDRWYAVVSSILYTLAIYRLTDIYVRCALGEAIAFAFLPLLIRGIWSVWFEDKNAWPYLTLGVCAIFFSHMLTVLMFFLGMVFMFAFYLPRLLREKRIFSLFKAGCFACLICLTQIIPMIDYLKTGVGPTGLNEVVSRTVLSPAQLFLWGNGEMPAPPGDPTLSKFPAEIGLPLIIGVILSAYSLLTNNETAQKNRQNIIRFTVIGTLGAFATTTFFPWNYLSLFTNHLSDFFQFAWRFLIIPTIFFSLSSSYGYCKILQNGEKAAIFILILSVIMVLPTLSTQTRFNDVYQFGESAEMIIQKEYNIPGTNAENVRSRAVVSTEGVEITDYVKDGNTIFCSADTDKNGGQIQFPLFGFMGYQAEINGKIVPYTLTGNNLITVDVNQGHSHISIRYVGKAIWRLFDLLSLVSFLLLIILMSKSLITVRFKRTIPD